MSHLIGEKTLDCLVFISLNSTIADDDSPTFTFSAWQERYDLLCAKWDEKAVWKKLEQLSDRGYIDYGVSPRMGWLTDEGIAKLREFAS